MSPLKRGVMIFIMCLLAGLGLALAQDTSFSKCLSWAPGRGDLHFISARSLHAKRDQASLNNSTAPSSTAEPQQSTSIAPVASASSSGLGPFCATETSVAATPSTTSNDPPPSSSSLVLVPSSTSTPSALPATSLPTTTNPLATSSDAMPSSSSLVAITQTTSRDSGTSSSPGTSSTRQETVSESSSSSLAQPSSSTRSTTEQPSSSTGLASSAPISSMCCPRMIHCLTMTSPLQSLATLALNTHPQSAFRTANKTCSPLYFPNYV
ncbi:hypothetical protein UVI_02012070 [Ustilaginoidea virens]|uniref:Uncharacterized protein n=1 Tax=Ustilaginoidea virens TaxID=1159556 RepID=A0A1B5L0H4_USTVR|nr:hypothetical protein UVI_02012070 [Ustilaginoidea virens]